MRRGLLAALAAAMLVSAGLDAEAQTPRWWMRMQRMQQMQGGDPGFIPDAPPPAFLPPSAAARRALQDNPGARLLGIQRNNRDYVITLRQRGALRRVIIPGN